MSKKYVLILGMILFFHLLSSAEEICFNNGKQYAEHLTKLPKLFKELPLIIGTNSNVKKFGIDTGKHAMVYIKISKTSDTDSNEEFFVVEYVAREPKIISDSHNYLSDKLEVKLACFEANPKGNKESINIKIDYIQKGAEPIEGKINVSNNTMESYGLTFKQMTEADANVLKDEIKVKRVNENEKWVKPKGTDVQQ